MHKKNIFLRIALVLLIATLSTGGVFVGSGTIAKFIAQAPVVASATVAGFDVRIMNSAGSFAPDGKTWLDNGDWVRFDKKGASAVTIANLFVDFGKGRAKIFCTEPWGSGECHVDLYGACDHEPGDPDEECLECYADGRLIAPGMMGKMELTFNNLSDVSVEFYLDNAAFAFSGVAANLKFFVITSDDDYGSVPGVKFGGSTLPLNENEFSVPLSGLVGQNNVGKNRAAVTIHPGGNPKTIYVWWIWPFEAYDSQGELVTAQDVADTSLGIAAQLVNQVCTATFNIKAEQVD